MKKEKNLAKQMELRREMVKGPGVNICSECTMIAVQYLILNDRMPSAEAQSILDAFWGKCR